MEEKKSLGQKIYELRRLRGISQEELGFELGVTRQTVSRWELDFGVPNGKYLVALCEYFGIKVNYLFDENQSNLTMEDESTKPEIVANEPEDCKAEISAITADYRFWVEMAQKKKKIWNGVGIATLIATIVMSAIITVLLSPTIFANNQGGIQTVFSIDINWPMLICIISAIVFLGAVGFGIYLIIKKFKNKKK